CRTQLSLGRVESTPIGSVRYSHLKSPTVTAPRAVAQISVRRTSQRAAFISGKLPAAARECRMFAVLSPKMGGMADESHDVAIIGAGPIGIELAVALKRRDIDYVHFDAKQIGYTISWFAPQTQFFSSNERIAIAGVPLYTPNQAKATREQYLT